jgi:hypothetical protein
VKYIVGILRRKRLAAVAPDLAEEKHRLDISKVSLQAYWDKQSRGTGYLNETSVAEWLKYCTVDEIKAVMHGAQGYWADLQTDMDRIAATRKQTGQTD